MRGILSREPVRAYLYGVVVAVVAALAALGVVSETAAPLILAVSAAVLAVPAVEVARAKVSPVAVKSDPVDDRLTQTIDDIAIEAALEIEAEEAEALGDSLDADPEANVKP